jgi:UDP-glucuronate decarboxylase
MRTPPMFNVLIAGGAGFIGSNLCDRLVQKGHRVICVDNLLTGHINNIRPLLNHPNFEFFEHDIQEPLEIRGPIHRIYNLACAASPVHLSTRPSGNDENLRSWGG